MDSLIIPEIVLLDAYQKALKFIRKNYKTNIADPTKSYLGIILGSSSAIERYNLIEQAKAVFVTETDNPRHILVNLFFNAQRAAMPTIHITNPAESPIHDALNISTGFQQPIFDDDDQTYTDVFNRRFKAKYSIVLTSDNTNEIVLMHQVLRSITISMIEHLNMAGLENIRISSSDIQLKSDIVPPNVFIKAISIEFEYDVVAIKLSTTDFSLGDFEFVGTILPVT